MKELIAIVLGLFAFALISTALVTTTRANISTETFADATSIYCLMVTGKDDERIKYAKESVRNFLEQSYPVKHLIIVNHHPTLGVIDGRDADNITEITVDKVNLGLTLGDLRNISLSKVPQGAIWTTWDDDDIRSKDYLSLLFREMTTNDADVVLYKNRFEYNVNTDFAWQAYLPNGAWIFFAKHDARYRYAPFDTKEDNAVKDQIKTLNKNVHLYDNDPSIYIRLVHSNNTSFVVDPKKKVICSNCDTELEVSDKDAEHIKKIVKTLQTNMERQESN